MTYESILREIRGECCTTVRDGQVLFVTCADTKREGIWSPGESGTYEAWCKEHRAAHERQRQDENDREMRRFARCNALHIYRTTEPGDPARRGIGSYL